MNIFISELSDLSITDFKYNTFSFRANKNNHKFYVEMAKIKNLNGVLFKSPAVAGKVL